MSTKRDFTGMFGIVMAFMPVSKAESTMNFIADLWFSIICVSWASFPCAMIPF